MDPFNRLRRLHLYRCQQTQKQSAAICVEIPRLRIFHTVELEVGMKSLHDPVWDFTYRVEYLRTQDWYDSGGRWRELSDWCTETFGGAIGTTIISSFVLGRQQIALLSY